MLEPIRDGLCWLLFLSGLFLAQNIDQPTHLQLLKNKGKFEEVLMNYSSPGYEC
jgi:hypothetical protein